ncbi:hypothetical protein HZ326_4252 [Fusarium oxysporum f. sp. albedinis]|nr:hypothetical protein HZ326_4252 [Fusarium oxysporum f. sp. albedinis]
MTMNSSSAGLAIWQAMDYELKEEAPPDQGLLERKSLMSCSIPTTHIIDFHLHWKVLVTSDLGACFHARGRSLHHQPGPLNWSLPLAMFLPDIPAVDYVVDCCL